MTRIVVSRFEEGWCVRGGGALFHKAEHMGDALRTAEAHASAVRQKGERVEVVVTAGSLGRPH